jgi:hypothetical protein
MLLSLVIVTIIINFPITLLIIYCYLFYGLIIIKT